MMDKYLKSIPGFLEEWWKKERDWEMKKAELEVGKELVNEMKAYWERFKGEGCMRIRGRFVSITTEPLTVDIWIYQEHFEDANGTRKFYADGGKRQIDLNIKLRLTIDTRTRKLLSAFCREEFIVNGQIITNFGTGLCIFKSE